MSDEALVAYCEARDAVQRHERATREARTEQVDAERTLGGLLSESMARHAVACVPAGEGRYVRLAPAARRAMAVKTEEDALSLVEDVARHVRDVPAEELPAAVVALVRERARARGPPPGPPRVRVLSKLPVRLPAPPPLAPAETQRLLAPYLEARRERAEARAALAPLRAARKRTEAALLPQLHGVATVRMAAPAPASDGAAQAAAARTLRVEVAPPRAARSSSSALGVRALLELVRAATEEAAADRVGFDAALRAAVARRLRERPTAAPGPARVRVTRGA
tara:strand:- start:699 stop:1541 length:843 start_codon:yes stop_codon:yes gene_type:complete